MKNEINSLIQLSGFEITEQEKQLLTSELETFLKYAQIIDQAIGQDQEISHIEKKSIMRDDTVEVWQQGQALLNNGPNLQGTSYLVPPQKTKVGEAGQEIKKEQKAHREYEAVIGLEVHAQLNTKSKLFCHCSTQFGCEANHNTCPVCTGQPGALPVLNKEAVKMAILAGLAANCQINCHSIFARKNYFYPDSPKSYQISQFEKPICSNGFIEIEVEGKSKKVRLSRIHIEEDAGKTVHVGAPGLWGAKASAVDFNRTSVPLIEIVTEPDMNTAQEAREYVMMLRTILVSLGICDGNMEQGNLRCDANVSLRKRGDSQLGAKAEVKNMNSFKAIERALEFEIARQKKLLEQGIAIDQETRLWDDNKQKTYVMRTKEDSHDYRYFPDPDLLPLELEEEWIQTLKQKLPAMPLIRRAKYLEHKLSVKEAQYLMYNPDYADYFDSVLKYYANIKEVTNWFFSVILGFVTSEKIHIEAQDFAHFLKALEREEISGKIGKNVVKQAFEQHRGLMEIIEQEGLRQVSNEDSIIAFVRQALQKNNKQVEMYKEGKQQVFGYLIGQVMQASDGKANPKMVNKILRLELDKF